jgi:endonuclease-8
MPEGPEVHRAARRLARALEGRPLVDVSFGLERLEPWAGRLIGATPSRVEARGKAFVLHFDIDAALYVHLQLYGRWMVRRAGDWPATGRSLRAALHTDRQMALLYSASDVQMLEPAALAAHPYLAKLGPDPCDPATTLDQVRAQVASPRFRRRGLGGLLLDPAFVAGMGNYLRSEVLFDARLAPARRPGDLAPAQADALSRALLALPRRSLATGGVTAPPDEVAAGRAAGRPRRRWRHRVFAQAGHPCPRCGASIQRTQVSGRRLYLCGECQA